MNYQGKNKLFISVGLIVILLVTSLTLFIIKEEARNALMIILPIVILFALVGVYVSYIHIENIKKRINQLPNNYQSVYFDIHELVSTYRISKDDKNEIMRMVLEIFEHARLEERDIDDVVGDNLSKFANEFIEATGKRHSVLDLFSYTTALFVGYLLLIKFYKVIRRDNITLNTINSEALDLGLVVTYFLIAYIFVPWLLLIIQRATRQQWRGLKRILILIPFIIPIGLFGGLILVSDPDLIRIIEYPVPIFSSIWSIGIGILLLIGSLLLPRLQNRK